MKSKILITGDPAVEEINTSVSLEAPTKHYQELICLLV